MGVCGCRTMFRDLGGGFSAGGASKFVLLIRRAPILRDLGSPFKGCPYT